MNNEELIRRNMVTAIITLSKQTNKQNKVPV